MKKLWLISIMMVAAALAFGGGQAQTSAANAVQLTPTGSFPIVREPVTLRMLAVKAPDIEDLNTNEFAKYYEERTNVRVIFDQIPSEQQAERLNIVMAAGDYPEIITGPNIFSRTQLLVYGSQGVFLPLNQHIDSHMPLLSQMFAYNDEFRASITAPDGNIYAFPTVAETFHVTMPDKMWVYEPWLDQLGLAVPTTTEEFRQMLIAFRDQDPNGTGTADTVPLAGAIGSPQTRLHGFLMNAFVYSNTDFLQVDNGRVSFVANTDQWREGLRYLHGLYSEGLIAPESFTQSVTQLRQIGENPGSVILGAVPGLSLNVFSVVGGESGRFADYKTIAPLQGPSGLRQSNRVPYPVRVSMVLTTNAQYPEVAARWVDTFYTPLEGGLWAEYGQEDQGWERAQPGQIGIDGQPAHWRPLRSWGQMQNIAWVHTIPFFNSAVKRNSQVAGPLDQETILFNETARNYAPYAANLALRPLFFTEAQALEMAQIQTNVTDFVNQSAARFIVGDLNLERDWDSYVNDLERMGLRRYVEIHQAAYGEPTRQ